MTHSSRLASCKYLVLTLLIYSIYLPPLLNQPSPTDSLSILSTLDDVPEIAFTLDDAPMPGTVLFKGMAKTQAIIQQLRELNCPPVGIFAIGLHAQGTENMKRLRMYGQANHIIANHTYHHYSLNKVDSQTFIEDVQRAHACLATLPNFRPWLRFPFLHKGKTAEKRRQVRNALAAMGYQEGYITISNYDYYLNHCVVKAVKAGKKVNYEELKAIYIQILWDCIVTYEQLAQKVLGRKVRHVLLLHENDLAALFIGDLIRHIRSQGWRIIGIEQAYQDPIATEDLQNIHGQMGRLGAIAEKKGLGKHLVTFPISTTREYIDEVLAQKKVFTNP